MRIFLSQGPLARLCISYLAFCRLCCLFACLYDEVPPKQGQLVKERASSKRSSLCLKSWPSNGKGSTNKMELFQLQVYPCPFNNFLNYFPCKSYFPFLDWLRNIIKLWLYPYCPPKYPVWMRNSVLIYGWSVCKVLCKLGIRGRCMKDYCIKSR